MEYRLLQNPEQIRRKFARAFLESYESFSVHHKEWIAKLPIAFNKEFYDTMFMWDRIIEPACRICFADALEVLNHKKCDVLFLTESPQSCSRQRCRLNNQFQYVAVADAQALAECISYEWFTEYELLEQGRYLADPILPSEVYVFDKSFSWCLIFTHETDETETAESRLCLFIGDNVPNP